MPRHGIRALAGMGVPPTGRTVAGRVPAWDAGRLQAMLV